MRSRYLPLLVIAVLGAGGCSLIGPSGTEIGATAGAQVDEEGFSLELAEMTLAGGKDSFTPQTEVVGTVVEAPESLAALELPSSAVVEFTNPEQSQSEAPLELAWQIPSGTDPDSLAMIATTDGGQTWQGEAVTISDSVATAELESLATVAFVTAADYLDDFATQLAEQPETTNTGCEFKVTGEVWDYEAQSTSEDVTACLQVGETLEVTLASSGLAGWGLTSDNSTITTNPASDTITTEIAESLYQDESDSLGGYLITDAPAVVEVPDDAIGSVVVEGSDAGVANSPLLGAALEFYSAEIIGNTEPLDQGLVDAMVGCEEGAPEANGNELTPEMLNAWFGCADSALTEQSKTVNETKGAVMKAVAPQLTQQLTEVSQSPNFEVTVAEVSKAPPLTVDGIGPFKVDMSPSEAQEDGLITTEDMCGSSGPAGNDYEDWPISFRVFNNQLHTMWASEGILTDKGIGVGSTAEEIQEQYPDAEAISFEMEGGIGSGWLVDGEDNKHLYFHMDPMGSDAVVSMQAFQGDYPDPGGC